ncbi:isochorismate synthase [Arthrobacter sp. NIO-1057]|uniref:isochorismate synthase n=1 Tax=Arthrobacter sp. NIO-1057 TaxID=993071 RepID=UPI00071D60C3|nr:isochorismate synthase [Arthrobacter sp. NIO-1057]KSU67294.1 isochorismate synthase [Arthrobacter sp. NIO-1057]SCC03260.1 isochorismate synthase [Arthrobacter sp. NIO-1057]
MSADSPVLSASAHQPSAPSLTSITFEYVDAPLTLLDDSLRHRSLVWTRNGHGLLGFGTAARLHTHGEERFARARAWFAQLIKNAQITDTLNRPGTGLVSFGSFAFSFTSVFESRMIIPQLVIGRDEQTAWITLTGTAEELDGVTFEHALERAKKAMADAATADSPTGSIKLTSGQLTAGSYVQAVKKALGHFDERGISKLVLARDVLAHSSTPIDLSNIVHALTERYGNCWTYSVDGLVGATPEMLVRVTDGLAEARVLAGTLDRASQGADEPDFAQHHLFEDPKQRNEHQLAIDSLTDSLNPISHGMSAPDEPFILQLPNVWHLASDVRAQLRADATGALPSALDVAEIFHPTAAVCGTPTKKAGVLLRELEGMDRGPYAGPVGWVDSRGDGEFGIALRGGILEDEKLMRLYAGCGIVPGSVPEDELAESWAKMRPMRQALGAE